MKQIAVRITALLAVLVLLGHFFYQVPPFETVAVSLLAALVVILSEILIRADQKKQSDTKNRELESALLREKEKARLEREISAQRFEKIFRLGPAPMAISRLSDGTFVDMNQMYLDFFEYTRDQIVGKTSRELNIIGDEERAKLIAEVKEKGFARNVRIDTRTRSGEERHALFSSEILEFGSEPHMLSILFDVTDLRKAESLLRKRESELARTQKIARLADWTIDLDARSGYWNSSFAQLHSKPESWQGCSLDEYLLNVPEEDRPVVENSIETCALTGKNVTFDHRIKYSDGEARWLNVRMDPVLDDAGKTVRIRGISQDITDRVRLEGQLRQSQKLDAVGQLAGGIAHDMNNILGIVFGHLDMAAEDLPADHPVQENLAAIKKASQRGTDLVRRILNVSSPRAPEGTLVDPGLILKETLALLRATLPAMIAIKSEIERPIPEIKADGTQLHQIIMNLATNASHAMENQQSGILTLELKLTEVDDALAAISPNLRVGPYVRLSISDTGCGMDHETQERIFEPFFTTKPAGKGTGLGLAIVHGIVRRYGGALTVYSEVGRGTTFRIYLPVPLETDPQKKLAQTEVNLMPGKGEQVLCVDDEVDLLSVCAKMLDRMGFVVTRSNDPIEALNLLHTRAFDLMLTDQSMPGMTGIKLAEQAQSLNPQMPILVMSGNFVEKEIEECERQNLHRINKPASREELARMLNHVLRPPSP